jgi:hypothetical protein
MNGTAIALISAGCIFSGTLLGLAPRRMLPDHHLADDSKDAIKIGAGMISMMSALVLGLLVSSAKNSFDATNTAIIQGGAKVTLLEFALGPDLTDRRTHANPSWGRC